MNGPFLWDRVVLLDYIWVSSHGFFLRCVSKGKGFTDGLYSSFNIFFFFSLILSFVFEFWLL